LDQLKVVGRFLFFSSGTALGHVLFASVDRLVVGAVVSVSAVAYYSVSIAIAVNLLAAADMLTRPLMPAVSDWARRGDWQTIRICLGRVTAWIAVVELLIGTALILLAHPLLTVWLGQEFSSQGTTAFRVLVAVFAIVAVGAPAFHVANGIGRPWITAVGGATGGALTILLIAALAPRWGIVGAAVANVAGLTALLPLIYLAWKLPAAGSRDIPAFSDPSHA
jgi:O-antigen/teichoic acid export membrane protein